MVAIIQARLGSTRLPGKALRDIGGKTMLARVVRRAQRARSVDEVLVATTTEAGDEPILAECAKLEVPVFRGDAEDVLDRTYRAAQAYHAEGIVRVTSDCPLIDPGVIDKIVRAFLEAKPDYASNVIERTYPRGLDTEVMSLSALGRVWRQAAEPYQRIHVCPYFYQNPEKFDLLNVTHEKDYSADRWTVDTSEDLAFVREVYRRLGNDDGIRWTDVLALLEEEPALGELNREIQQKELHEG
jgi:spore coat polysaccharide biosynthesis protein SpsF